jgi:hypothetical protein
VTKYWREYRSSLASGVLVAPNQKLKNFFFLISVIFSFLITNISTEVI